MSVSIPPSLRPGDTIAIVPTARAITVEELRDGIALAESWGLKVKLGAGIGRKHFQQAGTAEERAADLQAALNDPAVRAIWCARGGYGTVHLMDHLDLSSLKRDPKWIVGFSDITVLHNARCTPWAWPACTRRCRSTSGRRRSSAGRACGQR